MSTESSRAVSPSYSLAQPPFSERALLLTSALTVSPLLCVVSAVALPIFGVMALWNYAMTKYHYNRTLTDVNGDGKATREPFGRIRGQDYNHVFKHAEFQIGQERQHIENCPFKSKEDLLWLDKECDRRESEDRLNSNLKMMRLFAKGLIPFIGSLWIVYTEGKIGGALLEIFSCDVDSLWSWRDSIDSHRNHLSHLRH